MTAAKISPALAAREHARVSGIDAAPITDRASWLTMRAQDVTASAVGALGGVHPYVTRLALWAEKTGAFVPDAEITEAQERGLDLEPSFVKITARHRPGWQLEGCQHYFRDPVVRIGATPDFWINGDDRGPGLLQAKTVAPDIYKRDWQSDRTTVEPPLWVRLQLLTEMMLTGVKWGAIACLVVDRALTFRIVEQERHPGAEDQIRQLVAEFWADIDAKREPAVDYARDAETVARLYSSVRKDAKLLDLRGDNQLPVLRAELEGIKGQIKALEARKSEIDTEFRSKLGDNGVALLADGHTCTLSLTERAGYVAKPTSFRTLRFQKPKL